MSRELELVFQNPERFRESRAPHLRQWLSRLVREVAPQADSFAVSFVNEEEMRELNRSFRGRDAPTDVLSFPGEATEEGCHLGDVAVSVGVARLQAERAGRSSYREVQTLLLHGVLHCLGYDHETDSGEMSSLESRLRRVWIRDEQ
ncbi:MAG: rRNA maturation RNase YbeY [Thermoanaerobaculia bacterium]